MDSISYRFPTIKTYSTSRMTVFLPFNVIVSGCRSLADNISTIFGSSFLTSLLPIDHEFTISSSGSSNTNSFSDSNTDPSTAASESTSKADNASLLITPDKMNDRSNSNLPTDWYDEKCPAELKSMENSGGNSNVCVCVSVHIFVHYSVLLHV